MHICIIGGIFDKPEEYRDQHSISPETLLAQGLRSAGWRVSTAGHSQPIPKDNFDIIHVHHFGRAALRLAIAAHRPPFVFTSHDPFAMNGLPVGWKRRLTDRFVLSKADGIVALSNAERNFLTVRHRLAPGMISVIPNGINTNVFDRVEGRGRPSDLLFVGQLREFKGLDYLLEALPIVREAHPQARLRIVYQTSLLAERYQRLAKRLGVGGGVDFAGPQTATKLAKLYSSAAVVVSPSLGECLSTVVLEAMCCGAAIVATDVGGIREQLDAETGVIVGPRDAAALARAIGTLLDSDSLRSRLGTAARRKGRTQFSLRQMIDRHLRFYEELLEGNERAA